MKYLGLLLGSALALGACSKTEIKEPVREEHEKHFNYLTTGDSLWRLLSDSEGNPEAWTRKGLFGGQGATDIPNQCFYFEGGQRGCLNTPLRKQDPITPELADLFETYREAGVDLSVALHQDAFDKQKKQIATEYKND
jgi:hypothetical protein